jgi:hypothetical protein
VARERIPTAVAAGAYAERSAGANSGDVGRDPPRETAAISSGGPRGARAVQRSGSRLSFRVQIKEAPCDPDRRRIGCFSLSN